jgi:hypothetical protein
MWSAVKVEGMFERADSIFERKNETACLMFGFCSVP